MPQRHALIALAALLLLAAPGCDDSGATSPATPVASSSGQTPGQTPGPAPAANPLAEPPAVAPPAASGPARIEFTSTTVDFGSFPETQTKSGKFEFRNAGSGTLTIRQVKPTCGCTAVSPSKTSYAPGEAGTIDVTFDPTAPGEQRKYVDVLSNSEPDASVRLMVVADVKAFIDVEPRMLEIGIIDFGKEYQNVVAVSCPDPNFEIQSLRATNPSVSARVLDADEARRHAVADALPNARVVEVTVAADAGWGTVFSWLEITVRGEPIPGAEPITHMSKIRVQGKSFGALAAEPDSFRFGVDPGQAFERRLTLQHRRGEPFNVIEARIVRTTLPSAEVRVQPLAAGRYEVIVNATGGTTPSRYDGVVTIRTDVPGEEVLEIPLIGIVRGSVPGS